MALVTMAGVSAGTSTVSGTTDNASRFGDIPSNIYIGSKQAVRRNYADTGFEAYQTDLQTIVVRVRSSDYAGGLTKGTVVYIGGATGNRPYVLKADADLESTSSKTFGILAENIAANGDGLCAVEGVLTGLDLRTSNGWADGDQLWLSQTAGEFTKTVPAEPAHAVFIGTITRAHPELGTIVVQIQNGYELNEIHGVLLDNPPANGDVLTYETSSGLWKNKPASGGGGIEVLSISTTDTAVTNATTDTHSYTIGAGKLDTNGDTIRATWAGQTTFSGADTLTIGLRFADTALGGVVLDSTTAADWEVIATITRTSATAAKVRVVFNAGLNQSEVSYTNQTTGIDWTGTEAIALRIVSSGATATGTTRMSTVEFLPAP